MFISKWLYLLNSTKERIIENYSKQYLNVYMLLNSLNLSTVLDYLVSAQYSIGVLLLESSLLLWCHSLTHSLTDNVTNSFVGDISVVCGLFGRFIILHFVNNKALVAVQKKLIRKL